MNKIYARKIISNHALTHEVNIKKSIYDNFFHGVNSLVISGKVSGYEASVTINNVTDHRFGGQFKDLLNREGGLEFNDIIVINYTDEIYQLQIVKPNNELYTFFSSFFGGDDRHYYSDLNLDVAEDLFDYNTQFLDEQTISNYYHKFKEDTGQTILSVFLTGIKYGKKIRESNLNLDEIVSLSNLNESYKSEFTKAISIGVYLDENLVVNESKHVTQKKASKEEYVYTHNGYNGKNVIVYGTPGCGKSYYVENILCADFDQNLVERTTFYQGFSYTDFIGQILPIVKEDETVTYEFLPGPFTVALNKAINHPNEKVALIIEELNRGNSASIFGDIFQLLDRDNGMSEYPIKNYHIQNFLEKINPKFNFNQVRIPDNLSIYATLNTSDQNVFTLDNAFKRRWENIKISNKFEDINHPYENFLVPGMNITWRYFVEVINKFIINDNSLIQSEDKQLGIFFIDEKTLKQDSNTPSTREKLIGFSHKVLDYLWNDVAKLDREKWFNSELKTLDHLVEKYINEGLNGENSASVFNFEF